VLALAILFVQRVSGHPSGQHRRTGALHSQCGLNDDPEETTGRDAGTSFAPAIVAGAAALCLQRHDRQSLISALAGRAPLQALFQAHLAATAMPGAGDWDANLDGPGILDVARLLDPSTMPSPSGFPLPLWATPSAQPIFMQSSLSGVSSGPALGGIGQDGSPPLWLQSIFGGSAGEVFAKYAEELVQLMYGNPAAAAAQGAADAFVDSNSSSTCARRKPSA
jgi:hypothetical protein